MVDLRDNRVVNEVMKMKVAAMVISLAILLCGCNAQAVSEKKTEITILAAASLTEAFHEIEKAFEEENTHIDLTITFAGSASLAHQIKEGVKADVYVSANEAYMEDMVLEKYISQEDVHVFAHNKLVVMVYKDQKHKISSLEDLIQKDVTIILAEEAQPIGQYTMKMLDKIQQDNLDGEDYTRLFKNNVISYEHSVKAVVAKIEIGEAHCGIVYATDRTKANEANIITLDIPDACNQMATYTIGKLAQSQKGAEKFVDYVLGEKGRQVLEKYHYILP